MSANQSDSKKESTGTALTDPMDAPATADEVAASERLRALLDPAEVAPEKSGEHDLVDALRAAARPTPIAILRHQRLVNQAAARLPRPRPRVAFLLWGAGTAAAAAAAVVWTLSGPPDVEQGRSPSALLPSRSTEGLFRESFPATGGTSERVGRIALARERDFRSNRFQQWGAR